MKAFINISVVVISLLGILGLYISLKGDVPTTPVVTSQAR